MRPLTNDTKEGMLNEGPYMVDWEVKRDKNNPDLCDRKSLEAFLEAKNFERLAKWPVSWKFQAQILLIASQKIFDVYEAAYKRELERDLAVPFGKSENESQALDGKELDDFLDSQLLPVCLLLQGFAIENLLKGIIFSKYPERVIETDKNLFLDGQMTNHDLCSLYKEAGLAKDTDAIDSETKKILKTLEQFSVWGGRYSIPKNLEQYKQKNMIPEILKNPKKVYGLYRRLFSILNDIPHPPTH